jgi:hypothetical protein
MSNKNDCDVRLVSSPDPQFVCDTVAAHKREGFRVTHFTTNVMHQAATATTPPQEVVVVVVLMERWSWPNIDSALSASPAVGGRPASS